MEGVWKIRPNKTRKLDLPGFFYCTEGNVHLSIKAPHQNPFVKLFVALFQYHCVQQLFQLVFNDFRSSTTSSTSPLSSELSSNSTISSVFLLLFLPVLGVVRHDFALSRRISSIPFINLLRDRFFPSMGTNRRRLFNFRRMLFARGL